MVQSLRQASFILPHLQHNTIKHFVLLNTWTPGRFAKASVWKLFSVFMQCITWHSGCGYSPLLADRVREEGIINSVVSDRPSVSPFDFWTTWYLTIWSCMCHQGHSLEYATNLQIQQNNIVIFSSARHYSAALTKLNRRNRSLGTTLWTCC